MSETIEERYLMVVADIEALRYLKFTHEITKEEVERIETLLSDLMAERKSVDLDTLFPKEVMEKAEWFGCYHAESGEYTEPGDTPHGALGGYFNWLEMNSEILLDKSVETEMMAYDNNDTELARVRVRLGLRVERVED